jgi:hypothetical protein
VVAVYDNVRNTIYLPDTWTGTTPAELSILVHEMVHHLQARSRLTYGCPAAREELAYLAQEQWLAMFDLSLESEFGIDQFTLKVTTSCMF